MLNEKDVEGLLKPFELDLNPAQVGQLLTYLDLLLRWNVRINLTSVRTPEECVTRHFGESLYLARWVELKGSLLDVGSGAGFPGLALRIVAPELDSTLLEPVAKKRAFLKEAARACGFRSVEVRSERLEDFVRQTPGKQFDTITARAVGDHRSLILDSIKVLRPGGQICLWLGREQGQMLSSYSDRIDWKQPLKIPLGQEREIWTGQIRDG